MKIRINDIDIEGLVNVNYISTSETEIEIENKQHIIDLFKTIQKEKISSIKVLGDLEEHVATLIPTRKPRIFLNFTDNKLSLKIIIIGKCVFTPLQIV